MIKVLTPRTRGWSRRRKKKEKEEKKKKKVGENNGQLRFVRHHGWRTQARLDQQCHDGHGDNVHHHGRVQDHGGGAGFGEFTNLIDISFVHVLGVSYKSVS